MEIIEMRVSERSWHLRLVRWIDHGGAFSRYMAITEPELLSSLYVPRDLCSYFWMVVLALIVSVPLHLAGLVIWSFCWSCVLVFRVVKLLLLRCIAPLVVGSYKLLRPRSAGQERQDSLLVAYLKAQKRKLCPLIEVCP